MPGDAVSVLEAITARGGRIVYSVTIDETGQDVDALRTYQRRRRCGACGEHGHDVKRCMGPGVAPRPTQRERRLARWSS